jgi:hypothetical protein
MFGKGQDHHLSLHLSHIFRQQCAVKILMPDMEVGWKGYQWWQKEPVGYLC